MTNSNPDKPLEDRIAELAKRVSELTTETTDKESDLIYPPSNIRAWVERKWRPLFRKKEVLYMGTQENPTRVLDGSKHSLKDIVNPLVSPDGNRVLFIASEAENHPNIYVVSRNGGDLMKITFYGEGQYQNDSLKWVHPLRFRYRVPAHTKQTYDYKCPSKEHIHEVRMLEDNIPYRGIAYYDGNGSLVEEDFTQEEIQEAVSYFKNQLEKNIKNIKTFQKRLATKLTPLKEYNKSRISEIKSGISDLQGIIGDSELLTKLEQTTSTRLALQIHQQLSEIKSGISVLQDYIDPQSELLTKLEQIKDPKIAFIRSYLGLIMGYYYDCCERYVNSLCK